MHILLHEQKSYALRFDRGEELMESLKTFCVAEHIPSGYFFAIGAAEKVTIAYYDIDTKEYKDKTFAERLEIASLSGIIALLEKKPFIHAHGSFSDQTMKTYSGHVKKLTISATCEVVLKKFERPLLRKFNEDIGLNLLA